MGLPSFDLLYEPRTKITLMGDPSRKENWKTTIRHFVNEPFWPVGFVDLYAMTEMRDLPNNVNCMELYGIRVSWIQVPHPQQCLAFRFDMPERSIVIATDAEFHPHLISPDFLHFCKGIETLIFDAQYTPQEYTRKVGWGHSSWETAASIASILDVGKLVLTHHDPRRKDKEMDMIIEEANRIFPRTVAAMENMKI
jgi:ribonuclease BN (tRNA processing enzyme)